jgi:hypothetical protein
MPDLPLTPGTLATDCYPASAQAFYDEMFAKGIAVMPDIAGLLIQDAAPDPADRGSKGWIPTAGNIPIFPGYVFVWHATVGHWVCRNPIGASDESRRIYVGTKASVGTYDGGDANPLGIASGPMWEIDTIFDGSAPVGVGLIPGSSPAATILAPKDTQDDQGQSGEYAHTLTEAEGATGAHVHPVGIFNPTSDDAFLNHLSAPVAVANYNGKYISGNSSVIIAPETTADIFTLANNNGAGTVSDPHNNMQPYVGVFFLKRTARQFWIMG